MRLFSLLSCLTSLYCLKSRLAGRSLSRVLLKAFASNPAVRDASHQ
jgi:hypothetical protein